MDVQASDRVAGKIAACVGEPSVWATRLPIVGIESALLSADDDDLVGDRDARVALSLPLGHELCLVEAVVTRANLRQHSLLNQFLAPEAFDGRVGSLIEHGSIVGELLLGIVYE